jgi:L-threonylcarbamoyladenylate synthase
VPCVWVLGDNGNVKTLQFIVDPEHLEVQSAIEAIDDAAQILRAGGLVAMPTETVYGLGANALDKAAVERIFEAKQRPAWDPVIVHIANTGMLSRIVANAPPVAQRLMQAFWPGPLTLLLPRTAAVPDAVTAGRPLVGVRMPAHPVALELIRRAALPIAAPSANRFAHISPTSAEHVLEDLDGRIEAVLDAGPTPHGVESTVLDPSTNPMTIYRPGAVTVEQIRAIAGAVKVYKDSDTLHEPAQEALPSPGVGLRHYAPIARLELIRAPQRELAARLTEAVRRRPNDAIGVMLPDGVAAPPGIEPDRVFHWGRWDAPAELAHRLYAGLRALDAAGSTVIVCPLPPADGLGTAIRDRLHKAAR